MSNHYYMGLVALLIILVILIIISSVVGYCISKKSYMRAGKLSLKDVAMKSKKKIELLKHSDSDVKNIIDGLGKGIAEIAELEGQFNEIKSVVEKTVVNKELPNAGDLVRPDTKCGDMSCQEASTSTLPDKCCASKESSVKSL